MTANELYRQGLDRLEQAQIEDGGFDCLQLFSHYTGISCSSLLADRNQSVCEAMQTDFLAAIDRRCQGEPLQYILGQWEFYSLPFAVGRGVLIPRADTEILVDEALRLIENVTAPKVADLCAGSGCIAVSIAKNRPDATVTAVEYSDRAITYLRQNVADNQTTNVTVQTADVLAGAGDLTGFDLIVSNPPYIPTADIAGLAKEVHCEPIMALDGGDDGLTFYRTILQKWTAALNPNGMIAFEVGIDQAQAVSALLEKQF